MAEQNNNGGDMVDRAVRRAGVRPGSALEADVRANIYSIVGTADDAAETDRKLDRHIAMQKGDPNYASSFEQAKPQSQAKERVKAGDILRPTTEEFQRLVREGTTAG